MLRAIVRYVLSVVVVLAICGLATAHPFHVSIAEAEWNAETKRLEVALRVSPEDLEAALSKRAETKVRVEYSEDVDEQIAKYLNDHFTLRKGDEEDAETKPYELKWMGKEITTKAAWLYFEIDAPDGVAGLRLSNSMLIDEEESQINTVVVRDGKRKTTLRFDREHTAEVIRFDEKAKPVE